MRVFVVVILSILVGTATAEARGRKSRSESTQQRDKVKKPSRSKQIAVREDKDREDRKPSRDRGAQSVGVPWSGRLLNATRLRVGDGAHIRRPYRAWGTRTTVDFTQRAIEETIELFPKAHVLAIGDISAQGGGQISDHQSHQSGRDVDLGLYYKRKPNGYPTGFVNATEDNLDCAAMWTLLSKFVSTANKDGGVQVIFLDHDVQGIIYRWARDHGVSDRKLSRIFQYAHGRGAGAGLIRHVRNHANHIHVRFRCANADGNCR